MNRYILIF